MENSPLNRLPGELRNRIYELALLEEPHPGLLHVNGISLAIAGDRIKAARCNSAHSSDNSPNCVYIRPASYGLARTCRQIRQETQKLYFTLNDTLVLYPVDPAAPRHQIIQALQRWVRIVGLENVALLRHVEICMTDIGLAKREIFHTRTLLQQELHPDISIGLSLYMPEVTRFLDREEPVVICVDFGNVNKAGRDIDKVYHNAKNYFRQNRIVFDPRPMFNVSRETCKTILFLTGLKRMLEREGFTRGATFRSGGLSTT